ncbi:MAG: type II toxin-antitoxin system VapC family toxin [Gammaproteobacteria bacterium]|nr:type II toxin-antitoxin system VapC family toxin [Gammaproteobacteria bacterium]
MSVDRFAIGSRTYLDANIYIYAFEGIETYRRRIAELLAAIDRQDAVVIASELLFTELLPRPIREGRHDLVERYMELIQRTPRIHLAPVDRSVILRSVHLRANFGLRSIDALHLATALVHGCDTFVTNDRHVARVDRIRVLTLDDLPRRKSGSPQEPGG